MLVVLTIYLYLREKYLLGNLVFKVYSHFAEEFEVPGS